MGTTLTGTKPKDTYDSLIKVGDNGPIGATAKTLSDGLGNDLPISVSTSNVGIGTTAPDIFSRFYTRSVGIDSSGITKIQLNGTTYSGIDMGQGGSRYAELNTSSTGLDIATVGALPILFLPNGANRVSITTDGLTFNGDTAAANALDDYEEGTFTPALALGGGSVTYTTQTGTYTKIGRLVTIQIRVVVNVATTPSSTLEVTGLPFTISATQKGAITIWAAGMNVLSNVWVGEATATTTNLRLYTYNAGTVANPAADLQNSCQLSITASYEV
jgi:hypothetical protein